VAREHVINDDFNEPWRNEFQSRGQSRKEKRQTD